MNLQLSNWIAQIYGATSFLKRLYSALKDPVQRKRAEASGAYAGERFRSTGRKPQKYQAPWIGLPTTEQAERAAWISAIEGLLGLNLLVALGSASASKAEPAKLHRRLNQELSTAVREGVGDQAAGVADGAWQAVRKEGEESVDVRAFLRQEWLRDIRAQIQGLVDSKG